MTYADRLHRWNRWYEQTPEPWRFHVVVWALVVIGAINMLLTIAIGFPFGLLLVLAIAAIAAVRVPHALGWLRTEGEAPAASSGGARLEIGAPRWVYDVNRWYDGLSETTRPFVLLAVLAIPGAINMALTIAAGFPFGLLFLLAVLAVIAIRGPYAAGWLREPAAASRPALEVRPMAPQLGNESTTPPLTAAPQPAVAAPAGGRVAAERQPAEPSPPPPAADTPATRPPQQAP